MQVSFPLFQELCPASWAICAMPKECFAVCSFNNLECHSCKRLRNMLLFPCDFLKSKPEHADALERFLARPYWFAPSIIYSISQLMLSTSLCTHLKLQLPPNYFLKVWFQPLLLKHGNFVKVPFNESRSGRQLIFCWRGGWDSTQTFKSSYSLNVLSSLFNISPNVWMFHLFSLSLFKLL